MLGDQLLNALKTLGTTGDEVACSLRRFGITGRAMSTKSDPIARYLRQICGFSKPEVFCNSVSILEGASTRTYIKLPRAVRTFIKRFDSYHYTDLLSSR
jgi:hypothetical protein